MTLSEMPDAVQRVLLPVYLCLLAVWDIRTKKVPAALLIAGGVCGFLLRIADLAAGEEAAELCRAYLPGLAAGALLLLGAAFTRGAVGYGDGLCFCTLSFWLPWGSLFTLLTAAMMLCAVPGTVAALIRRSRKISVPFLPFTAGAYLLLRLAERIGGASP